MRVLITGGAGFIGSHIADRYLADGHEVTVVDDLSTGRAENINPRAEFCRLDIAELGPLEEVFARLRPEVVNHHAAQLDVRKSVADPLLDARVNIIGSLNLLELGVSTRLFAWVNMLVGRVRGGLAYVNIVQSTIFGSISGAALSDIAALGKIEITSMQENGYDKDFSCALTAASSLQSPLIPPSSMAILYSGVMSVSVGSVLLGGAVPGILMGLARRCTFS